MSGRLKIKTLEIHLAHGCNLSCESCSHYSNQGHRGHLTTADATKMFEQWHLRITPKSFIFLGGEPTINPKLPEFFEIARNFWPTTKLRLATNGFFLHRHPTLPATLQKIKNARIELSIHHDSQEYLNKIRPALQLLQSWAQEYKIEVLVLNSLGRWTKRYYGEQETFEPFNDEDQRKSWEICPAKHCIQLFEGKLWKCPPLAYLKLQSQQFRLSSSWDPYIQYQGLDSDCNFEALEEFFNRQDESFCKMCTSKIIPFKLPSPIR